MSFITANAAMKKPVIVTFIDLSKAFDCLQYDKLFKKMKYLGFTDSTIKWFQSYLGDRMQVT